ncbi:MAG: hypothetical protein AseanaTS_13240 [Candidatus Pelagadaptatus aseana]|uniref:CopG family ribbon-helix-helix protein n=1 Tax=Candidatus Pelagadaptatus aseana TaxID=3120508 RepID=UPI0039B27840
MSITSVRLTDDVERPLEHLSKKMDRSKSYLINQAVREFLARQSIEESRWEQTLEAIDSINKGNAVDEDDVNAWLNSWGTEQVMDSPKV